MGCGHSPARATPGPPGRRGLPLSVAIVVISVVVVVVIVVVIVIIIIAVIIVIIMAVVIVMIAVIVVVVGFTCALSDRLALLRSDQPLPHPILGQPLDAIVEPPAARPPALHDPIRHRAAVVEQIIHNAGITLLDYHRRAEVRAIAFVLIIRHTVTIRVWRTRRQRPSILKIS